MKLYRPLTLALSLCVLTACGGGGGGNDDSPMSSPAPSPPPSPPSPTPPSPPSPPSPNPSPANTVCGSAFLGNAVAEFSGDNCGSNAGCANTGAPNAIDNNRDTAAVMSYTGPGGGLTLIARTQTGTVIPAGQKAGALISMTSQAAVATTLSFTTYLNNVMQESGGRVENTLSPSTNTTPNFQRFTNTKPYDRIDVVVEQSGSVTTQIFEVCSE